MDDKHALARGYMHIRIGIFENRIAFGEDADEMAIGEGLLSFIYANLNLLQGRAQYRAEDFFDVHPYFRRCDEGWRQAFLKNLTEKDTASPYPDLSALIRLQEIYLKLLGDLYNKNGIIDESQIETLMEDHPILARDRCFYRMQFLKDGSIDYFISDFEECLLLELSEVLRRRVMLKICKNCGRLFIPKRSNVDYCLRVYTPDGRTCSEVGYTQTFAKSVKNDELLLAYTRAYKAHYARMTKPRKKSANMTREQFDAWYKEAKHKLELARAGVLDAEEYKAWLKI